MAKKIKDHYGKACAILLAEKIKTANSSKSIKKFSDKDFVEYVAKNIRGKEFLARMDVYSEALEIFLGDDYIKNLQTFESILGPKLKTETGMFIYGWWLWPVGRYVEKTAHLHLSEIHHSLNFIEKLTQRFTGEFAIRNLLEARPEPVIKKLQVWSLEECVHVRRLSSEGIRTRLPWAKKSTVFIEHFDEAIKILDNLKASPEKFVQKSVGNNINDLFKDAPHLAERIVKSWSRRGLPPSTQWILKHGQRSKRRTNELRP